MRYAKFYEIHLGNCVHQARSCTCNSRSYQEQWKIKIGESIIPVHNIKERCEIFIAVLVYFQEENDSLRCQLEAYKNEVDLVRSDLKTELDQKEKQMKMLQQTLQGMQQVGLESTSYLNLFRYCEEWNENISCYINLKYEINVNPKYL